MKVEGEYLVWADDIQSPCKYPALIGLNVSWDHAVEIAEARAKLDYPQGWERQGRNIFRSGQPGSPSAEIQITSFNDEGR